MTIKRLALALSCALLLGTMLRAADYTGTVTFNGLPVPGATITASQAGSTVATVTDEAGRYRLATLADGAWTIHVAMLGFVDVDREITVGAGADATPTPITLELRPFDEVARKLPPPTAAVPVQRAATTATIPPSRSDRTRAAAPGNAPAARPNPANPTPAAPAEEPANPANFNAADGLLINGSVNNGAASPFAQLAAFGNNRRGGRSLYNGGLGIVLGNSAWDARPYSFTGRDASRPSYDDIQILGTFSGPLKIPRMTRNGPNLYLGYQRNVDHNANAQSALMPTGLERSGDFSQSRDALGRPIQVVDPTTGQPFDGNRIPVSRISAQAASLLGLYPNANADATGYNYETTALTTTHTNNVQVRATQSLKSRDSLSGNVLYSRTTSDTTGLFGFQDSFRSSGTDAAINWAHRFSPLFSTRVRYQFLRQASATTPYFANRRNVSGDAGVSGNDQDAENWGPPSLTFASGLAGLSSPQFGSTTGEGHAVSGEVFHSLGRHSLTIGGGLTRQIANIHGQQDARGSFSFTGAASGSDIADFLLGIPTTSAIAFGNSDKRLRGEAANLFVSDDWRTSPSLTVTAGVRWEYEGPMHETGNRLANLDVAPDFSAIAPVTADAGLGALTGESYSPALLHADWRGVQPRLGVAWRPVAGSSLVVRGGYGMYRNTAVYQALALLLAQQPPFSKTFSVANSAAAPLTLANGFATPAGATTNTLGIDPDIRVGFAENWQASAQRDLPASLTIVGIYYGTRGHHLPQEFLPNTYPTGALNPCPTCPSGFTYVTSNGESHRNAGQVQLRRRLRNGLSASVQYTLAKATDNASAFVPTVGAQGASGNSGLSGAMIAQDWLNLDAEESRSSFDQRHLVVAQVQYTTGMGVTGGALLDGLRGKLFKGWTVTSQLAMGSGLPVTPIVLTPVSGTGVTGTTRASLTGVSIDGQVDGSYTNPLAFSAPVAGQWGNAGRNSITGPGTFSLGGGVARSFLARDHYTFDWRLDATNLLNVVTYSGINTIISSSQFGLPNRANTMRKIQTSLRMRF